jgi:tetratricopeptide (TPR) repeat protein
MNKGTAAMRKKLTLVLCALFCFCAFVLEATDEDCRKLCAESEAVLIDGNANKAGELALEASKTANDPVLKANALHLAVKAFRTGKMLYKEFQALDELALNYAPYTNMEATANRMMEIGDLYFAGEREPMFWSFRWVPWLKDKDRTQELYKRALERAPFAKGAPRARMRMAVHLLDDGKSSEALELLRESVRQSESKHQADLELKYSYLVLAEQLFGLAARGDGDGKYYQEALEVCDAFQKKFPSAPEIETVELWKLKAKDVRAKQLLDMADFYNKSEKITPATRYLNEILTKYPDTKYAVEAEKRLVKMDKTFVPVAVLPEPGERHLKYDAYATPAEEKKILVTPADSDNRFLLNVYDIKSRPANDEDKEKK